MELILHSRVAVIGNRLVEIHEMTASEIDRLKIQRAAALAVGCLLGMVVAWVGAISWIATNCTIN